MRRGAVKSKASPEEKAALKTDADRESFVFWLLQDPGVTNLVVSISKNNGQTWTKYVQKGDRDS